MTTPFLDQLGQLEVAASVPLVPGELSSWCRSVETGLRGLEPQWREQLREHAGIFTQIVSDEPSLQSRIDSLRETELDLMEHFKALRSFTTHLRQRSESHRNSWEPTDLGKQVRERLLQFVLDCRVHHQEITTWYAEAAYRDTGEVD